MSNISYKHFIYDHELMLYPYAPLGLLHNKGEWPTPKYNLSIIASVSIKDCNIVEWLTYHQTLGIDHIYLYCTDEDPTDLYRQIIPFTLGKNPFITFHHYRFSKLNTQISFHFIHNYLHETTWYIHLDTTDYIHIHKEQTLPKFLKNFTDIRASAVYFNIVPYNTSNIDEKSDLKTIFEQTQPINNHYIHTKIMIYSQSCPYQYIFHNLDKLIDHHINESSFINYTYNVLQQSMKEYYINFPNNAINILNYNNTQQQIINTAYIAQFCNKYNEQQNINNISELYIHSNMNIKEHNNHPTVSLHHYTINQYWKKTLNNVWKHSLFPAPLPPLSILSHNKPCQQSSAPEEYTTEALAKTLITGESHGTTQTITKKETNPWWEIDLQDNYIIKVIYLFNGIDLNIKNMSSFIIETSEDHQSWIKRHQKITVNLFGGVDGSYYRWLHPLGVKARWVRITVPGEHQILSLDQIQILGMKYKNFYIP